MHLPALFTVLLTTLALVLDTPKGYFSFRSGVESLKETRAALAQELSSLHSRILTTPTNLTNISEVLFIFPRSLLDSEAISSLGLKISGEFHDLKLGKSQNEVLIPENATNMFLFNSSAVSLFKESNNILHVVENSPPFKIPAMLDLVDYFMVFPSTYFDVSPSHFESAYSRGILKSTAEHLPLFRNCISSGKPLMVFVFDTHAEYRHEHTLSKIMNVIDYAPMSGRLCEVSTFFDSFAKNWVQKVGYENLIQSAFCTTENTSLEESFCLTIPQNQSVHLFPAFDRAPKISDNNMFQSQVFNKANGVLGSGARTFDEVTYDIVHDPTSSIVSEDKKLDELFMKVNKIKRNAGSIGKKIDDVNVKAQAEKDKLVPVKEKQDDFVPEKYNSYITKRSESEIQPHPDGGYIVPLSLLIESEVLFEPPRSRAYSQIIRDETPVLHKRGSVFSNDEDCERVTWYNIFHHSIFGTPKFCANQTTN